MQGTIIKTLVVHNLISSNRESSIPDGMDKSGRFAVLVANENDQRTQTLEAQSQNQAAPLPGVKKCKEAL